MAIRPRDPPAGPRKRQPEAWISRILRIPNPPDKDLVLINFPRPSPLNPCSILRMHISARASAPRLADLRALAPIGARGHASSRNYNSFRTDKLSPSTEGSMRGSLSLTTPEGRAGTSRSPRTASASSPVSCSTRMSTLRSVCNGGPRWKQQKPLAIVTLKFH